MKSILLMGILMITGLANAADSVVLHCSSDRRSVDGALQEFIIIKTSTDQYKFNLLVEGSGMGGAYRRETQVELSQCNFSKATIGVGECIEVTADGFRGRNRLSVDLAFHNGRDQLRATNYLMDVSNNEAVSQEISIDLSKCTFTQ